VTTQQVVQIKANYLDHPVLNAALAYFRGNAVVTQ